MIRNEDLEEIVKWADEMQGRNNKVHDNLLDVYEGNLKDHIDASIDLEFNSNAAYAAKQRVSPINILKRTNDKLAKVYSQGVERSASNPSDESLITSYEEWLDLDNKMSKSDSMYNLLRSCAFEPYLKNGIPYLRVLTPNQFTVWSNDSHDRKTPTVFIKYMGSSSLVISESDNTYTETVNDYILYDHDEWVEINSKAMVKNRMQHDFGRIPFTYMNMSISRLVPSPDEDSYTMAVLIPKLLSDLNYASKYQSHGIRFGIDVDVKNLDGNPDSFWEIHSSGEEGAKPQIGVLAPSVNIDQVLNLSKEQLIMYLESRSLKVGSSGKFENNMSGFAKLIDSADVTDVRKENMIMFKATEKDLWELLSIKHNIWVENGELVIAEINRTFSARFSVSIKYGDLTPIIDPQEKRDNLKFKLENRLTTYERAVREANPDLTEDEIQVLLQELQVEKQENTNVINNNTGPGVQDSDSE